MKGFKTIIFNTLLAVSVPALNSLAGVNWVEVVGPTWAMVIVAAINVALRAATTTPIGRAS